MRSKILLLFFIAPVYVNAQFIISADTEIGTFAGTDVTIISEGDVENPTANDFSAVNLTLSLEGANQKVEGSFVLSNLNLGTDDRGSATKTLTGQLIVTDGMAFKNGVLRVAPTSTLLYTGAGTSVDVTSSWESGSSYVDGIFYQKGMGERRFPVGKGADYLPLALSSVSIDDTVGIEAFAEDPGLVPQLPLVEVDQTRYWQVYCDNFLQINSTVQLYRENTSITEPGTIVVVEADRSDPDRTAINRGNIADPQAKFASSAEAISKPLLSIGRIKEVTIRIHDLITPYGDNSGTSPETSNDGLYIENLFPENTVTLMDRWGSVVKEWTNYQNGVTDLDFFKTLMPGNYICVVECRGPENSVYKETQMVTLLKTN